MAKKRVGRLLAVGVLIAAVAYWASPYVAAVRLAEAAKRRDIEAVVSRFDVPRIRISLARQIVRAYPVDQALAAALDPVARQAAGVVAVTYVDAMIAEHFSAETLAAALAGHDRSVSGSSVKLPGLMELDSAWSVFMRSGFTGPVSFAIDIEASDGSLLRLGFRWIGGTWRVVSFGLPREVIGEAIRLLKSRTG